MKSIFILLTIFLSNDLFAQNEQQFTCINVQNQKRFEIVANKLSTFGENQNLVDAFINDIEKNCRKENPEKKEAINTEIESLKSYFGMISSSGIIDRINNFKNDLDYLSKFRRIDPEVKLLEKLASAAKINFVDIVSKEKIDELNKIGFAESEKRNPAHGGSCTYVNNMKGDLLKNTRNQGGLGWCYAYAAADFLSFYTHTYISAIGAGIAYNTFYKKNRMNPSEYVYENIYGGEARDTIQTMISNGYCLESILPSQDVWNKDITFSVYFVEALEHLWGVSAKNIDIYNTSFEYAPALMNLSDEELDKITKAKAKDYFGTLYKKVCNNFTGINPKMRIQSFQGPKEKLLSKVDEIIMKGEPALITFLASSLFIKFQADDHSKHQVNVLGRRFQGGSCEYLIKNTWGTDCKYYLSDTVTCNDGNLWVREEDLLRTISDVYYAEK